MCPCVKQAYWLRGGALRCVPSADTLVATVLFVPGVCVGLLSIGTGYIIRQYVEYYDRLAAEEYRVSELYRAALVRKSAPKKRTKKKPRHRM